MLDDSHSVVLSSSERREVECLIVEEYNQTRQLPEFLRARALIGNVKKRWIGASKPVPVRSEGAAYGERILNSCCVSFEVRTMDSFKRFEPPDFRIRRIIGAGFLLNVACRRAPSRRMEQKPLRIDQLTEKFEVVLLASKEKQKPLLSPPLNAQILRFLSMRWLER